MSPPGYLWRTCVIIRGNTPEYLQGEHCVVLQFVVMIIPLICNVRISRLGLSTCLPCQAGDWWGGLSFLRKYFDSAFTLLTCCSTKVRAVPLPFTACEIYYEWTLNPSRAELSLSLFLPLLLHHFPSLPFNVLIFLSAAHRLTCV